MAFGNFEGKDSSENKVEQEKPEKEDFQEDGEKQSLGDKLKDGISKLFHKNEVSENTENDSENNGSDESQDKPKNQILDSNESRKEIRDQKLEEYDSKMFDSVKKQGEMLDRRSDLTPDEKNDMQSEMTENYKKAVAEYKDWLENESEYKDMPEG